MTPRDHIPLVVHTPRERLREVAIAITRARTTPGRLLDMSVADARINLALLGITREECADLWRHRINLLEQQ